MTNTPFLKHVADSLLQTIGRDLSRVAAVFPNKRASLFFNEYLVPSNDDASKNQPTWSPVYLTINELFCSLSPLCVADSIETVCQLYKIYVEKTGSSETLDFFYGWGERLLADFDDVDKNMVDPLKLFSNLIDIKCLDDAGDFLNDNQKRALGKFFKDFRTDNNTQIRQKFVDLWNVLLPIYQELNRSLKSEGKAYEGALYRNVIESLNDGNICLPSNIDVYVFVGFNVLDRVEEELFSHLKKCGKALFYWDYDVFYVNDERFEAGTFLRENLKKFPNALVSDKFFDNIRNEKTLEFVSAATESIQARSVEPWLNSHITKDAKETAVVLCNETLLEPILHVLPPQINEVNITKGYPLHHTSAYGQIERIIAEKYDENTDNKLWLDKVIENVKEIAQTLNLQNESLHNILNKEAYFQIYKTLSRLRNLVETGLLDVSSTTLHKLLRQVMRQQTIPFHGEPAVGLQIMGMLETRCLDFENILMLSVNEGNIPKRNNDNSFIPYVLKREFGLTTQSRKTAVYAYYFYRLIQRAKHVRMVYNCSANASTTGEMSRFMTQLLIENKLKISHYALTSEQTVIPSKLESIEKPSDIASLVTRLSPSAINTYIRCQKQFFFNYILKIKAPKPKANIIEPNTLGSVFHKAAELLYGKLVQKNGGLITSTMLESCLNDDVCLDKYIKMAIVEEEATENAIVKTTIKRFLKNLLSYDAKRGDIKIYGTEIPKSIMLNVTLNGAKTDFTISGIIDRVDILSSNESSATLRIIDYKTGGSPEKTSSIDNLFTPSPNHPHYILQTFIYALMMSEVDELKKYSIKPELFFTNKAADPLFSSDIRLQDNVVEDFRPYIKEFKNQLENLIAEILDCNRKFEPTSTGRFCESCDFYDLCYH